MLLSIPIVVVTSMTIIGIILGPAGIIGIVISALHIPLLIVISKFITKIRIKTSIHADSRVKLTSNLIECIKIVKLYGWEHPFLDRIINERRDEIRNLRKKLKI